MYPSSKLELLVQIYMSLIVMSRPSFVQKDTSSILKYKTSKRLIFFLNFKGFFFWDYTVECRHSQRTHTDPYERTQANPIPMSTFEN